MIQKTDKVLGVGKYKTRRGEDAVVDAVADGMLIGRYYVYGGPIGVWVPKIWTLTGRSYESGESPSDICECDIIHVKRRFWLNIYDDGPGLLRSTWEQALIESGCNEKQPLCRVEVKIDSYAGEGLK